MWVRGAVFGGEFVLGAAVKGVFTVEFDDQVSLQDLVLADTADLIFFFVDLYILVNILFGECCCLLYRLIFLWVPVGVLNEPLYLFDIGVAVFKDSKAVHGVCDAAGGEESVLYETESCNSQEIVIR
jgi:hypothetical protein